MNHSPIEVAKVYVAASNAHDLSAIEPMLSLNCEYQSSGVGNHVGRETILSMMKKFFADNPTVRWDAENWNTEGGQTAVFDFQFTLDSGSSTGREWITIDGNGLITQIRVAR